MSTGLPSSSSSARAQAARDLRDAPVPGLPTIRYHRPIIATILATLLIIIVLGILTLASLAKTLSQFDPANNINPDDATPVVGFCGVLSLIGIVALVYFILALVKGLRDLSSPVYYARGVMLDKRVLGGRKTGTWMGIAVRYAGPDLETAQVITDDQRAASPDRSKMFQPRGETTVATYTPRTKRAGSYLPTDRISSRNATSQAPRDTSIPRIVFRVDAASFEALDPDEEVLIAYSRHLQHIFYVAHLRGGEWESWVNKQLI
jgi:hypothetical protein